MKNLFIVLFLLVFANCYGQTSSYIIDASFEDGSRTANGKINLNSTGLACTSDCMQISDSFPRLGHYSQRSPVSILSPCNCGSSIRCEGKVIQDTSVKSLYYAVSMLPRLYYSPSTDNKDELSLQWKIDTDAVPPLSLWERPSGGTTHWFLILQIDTTRPNPTSGQVTTRIIDLGELQSDVYTDWLFVIDWQPNYTGSIQVYKGDTASAGTLYTTVTGANSNAFYNPSSPAYRPLRFGIYKFPWCNGNPPTPNVGEKIMYYDVLRIGNSDMSLSQFLIQPNPTTQTNFLRFNRPVRNSN